MNQPTPRTEISRTSESTEGNEARPNSISQKAEVPMASERANDSQLGVATNMVSATVCQRSPHWSHLRIGV